MPYTRVKKYAKKAARPAYKKKYSSYKKKPSVGVVKSIVNKAIARNIENKCFQVYNIDQPIVPVNNATFASRIFPVSPYAGYLDISQGVGVNSRIGNRIKIKYLSLAGVISPFPYNATTNIEPVPCTVVMWIFYDKTEPTTIPNPQSDFFDLGNSVTPITNRLIATTARVNTDKYRVLAKRVFKIGYAAYAGTGNNVIQQSETNNDFKLNQSFKINLTKHAVENVKYQDNNTVPTTRGLYCMCQAISASTATLGSGQIPLRMDYTIDLQYEDA